MPMSRNKGEVCMSPGSTLYLLYKFFFPPFLHLVMQDIIKRMLSEGVLSTLFTAQPLTTLKRLKANFNKLANTSLVNLSEGSMDKVDRHNYYIIYYYI